MTQNEITRNATAQIGINPEPSVTVKVDIGSAGYYKPVPVDGKSIGFEASDERLPEVQPIQIPIIGDAEEATEAANAAAAAANTAAGNANAAAGNANAAAGNANAAAAIANTAAGNANAKAALADEKAALAQTAASHADAKAALADEKATAANSAAASANAAAGRADTATTSAIAATGNANAATNAANTAANRANTAANRLSGVDLEVDVLPLGDEPTAEVTQTDTQTSFKLGIPTSNLGYATFEVESESMELLMHTPEDLNSISFALNNGVLEVSV